MSKYDRSDLMAGYPETRLEQAENIALAMGKSQDGIHQFNGDATKEGALLYDGYQITEEELTQHLAERKPIFTQVNERVLKKVQELMPEAKTTFSPYNGSETICAGTEITIATDRLPIGSPAQILRLYNNDYARGIYLFDKLDRGHSYTGVIQELGFLGSLLLWDIEDIQDSYVEKIEFLNEKGIVVQNLDENKNYPSIRIRYRTPNGQIRVHEQYTVPAKTETLLEQEKRIGTLDVLYLRGTHSLVTTVDHYEEYRRYVSYIKSGGIIVSDSKREDLRWKMEDMLLSESHIVPLQAGEQFGYAAKDAKVKAAHPNDAFQGYINILRKQ